VIVLAVFVALLVVTGWLYTVVPTDFPNEDQGYFISIIQAPEGFAEHQRYHASVETELLKLPETRATLRLVALILMVVLRVILQPEALGRASWRRAFCRGAERKKWDIFVNFRSASSGN